jgi:protein-S-isoprenylcysteine O-methyltransferase Ste14
MDFKLLFTIALTLWGVSEIAMAWFKRSRSDKSSRGDRGTLLLLVLVIAGSAAVGFTANFWPAARISDSEQVRWGAGLALVLCGAIVRWAAILTLGRYFTTNVAIQSGQQLVQGGVYRVLRHPSYLGTLLIMSGVAAATNNWANAALVMAPCVAAILRRIRVEEEALLEAFGQEYRDFCSSTRRLIPGIY